MGEIIGSLGVTLLLLAFLLNVGRRLNEQSRLYLWMNILGSALAAAYAAMTGSIPFVILETAWCLAALYRLFSPTKRALG